ncbi:MAG: hypothetical protein WC516_02995 [Patescibacteria group bacterium]
MIKKTLLIALSVLFFLPVVANAYSPSSGDLIKMQSNPGVYFIGKDLSRHLFSNAVTFWTWYTGTWAEQGVKVVNQDEFVDIPIGNNVTARPGAKYIKFDNSDIEYRVDQDNKICPLSVNVSDEDVVIIQSAFESNYTVDASCDKAQSKIDLPAISIINYIGITNNIQVTNNIIVTSTPNIINNIIVTTTPNTNVNSCYSDTWVCGDWGSCQSNGSQSRTCYKSQDCPSVDTPSPSVSQACNFNAPICTSWTYSDWSSCSLDGKQTRTVTQAYPSNCSTGNPILEQSCVSPITISFETDKNLVRLNDRVTLTWSVSGARSCFAEGQADWNGTKETSGTYSYTIDVPVYRTTLKLSCQNNTTTTSKSINVVFSYDGSYSGAVYHSQIINGVSMELTNSESSGRPVVIYADPNIEPDKLVFSGISMRGLFSEGVDSTGLSFALKNTDGGSYITPFQKCEQSSCNLVFDNLNLEVSAGQAYRVRVYVHYQGVTPAFDAVVGVGDIKPINPRLMPSNRDAIIKY